MSINAYSLDLGKKIVEVRQQRTPTSEFARTIGVVNLSVKRYAAAAREDCSLARKKRPGSRPKMDEAALRLLKADL